MWIGGSGPNDVVKSCWDAIDSGQHSEVFYNETFRKQLVIAETEFGRELVSILLMQSRHQHCHKCVWPA
jgi:hypothetical protein